MKKQLFSSLTEEISQPLVTRGSIPGWLNGVFMRNGPAKFEQGETKITSWGDGYAMLHKFVLCEGLVYYINRFLKTRNFLNDHSKEALTSYSTVAPKNHGHSLLERLKRVFVPAVMDNNNINVVSFQNRYFANSDYDTLTEINLTDLETIGDFKFHDDNTSSKVFMSSAHPCIDDDTGEVFNFITDFGLNTYFRIIRLDVKTGKKTELARIKRKTAVIMHSAALTPNYFVLIECPLEAPLWELIKVRLHYQLFFDALKWRPELDSKFHLVNRKTGEVTTVPTGAFYFYHTINAFEDKGKVVVDVCSQNDVDFKSSIDIDNLLVNGVKPDCNSYPTRFEVDLSRKEVKKRRYADTILEMPQFANQTHACKDYRYVYGLGLNPATPKDIYNQIIKLDKLTGGTKTWYEEGMYPEEPFFVKKPVGKTEDDGALLSVVRDLSRKTSFLLVLDAISFEELGRSEIPHLIPSGFHGNFFPANSIEDFEQHTVGLFRKEGFELKEVSPDLIYHQNKV